MSEKEPRVRNQITKEKYIIIVSGCISEAQRQIEELQSQNLKNQMRIIQLQGMIRSYENNVSNVEALEDLKYRLRFYDTGEGVEYESEAKGNIGFQTKTWETAWKQKQEKEENGKRTK